ncbi:dihydrodipicolinate reductase [Chloroflexota bacterium]
MKTINVVQFGCGPVGCSIAGLAAGKKGISIVGAVDLNNAGRDLGELIGLGKSVGITVSESADIILAQTRPDVVLHATGSVLQDVYPQLEQIIKAKANIISTCEELSYPFRKQPALAANLDKLAKQHNVTLLATGVNPGFLMDTWPIFMTGICQDVKTIKAVRIQDASVRRIPFQKKIGAGKTINEFNILVKEGILRHVGLAESIGMIAAAMGWDLDDITESIEPIIAESVEGSNYVKIKPGRVAGVKQIGFGIKNGTKLIILEFKAFIGAKESFDAVYITGKPDLQVMIKGGTHGDIATAAIVVNSIPRVLESPKGLLTMKDLAIVNAIPNNN